VTATTGMGQPAEPDSAASLVRTWTTGHVRFVSMERPLARNALSNSLKIALVSAIDEYEADDWLRAMVLSGCDCGAFSAGGDLQRVVGRLEQGLPLTDPSVPDLFARLAARSKPIVAAIDGYALGGGFELALACDLRFAAEGSYQIGLPEVNLGLFPGSGGTQRLPRLVGLPKGLDLIANATTMKPADAKAAGLVDQLFPDAAACRAGALAYASKLAEGPTVAIGHAKLAVTQGFGAPLDLGLAIEREAIGRVFASSDAEEGIKAFGEKRKAEFTGE